MRDLAIAFLVLFQFFGFFVGWQSLPFEHYGDPNTGSLTDSVGRILTVLLALAQGAAAIVAIALAQNYSKRFRMFLWIIPLPLLVPSAIYLLQSIEVL